MRKRKLVGSLFKSTTLYRWDLVSSLVKNS